MLKKCALCILGGVLSLSAADQVLCSLGASSPYRSSTDQRPTSDAMQLAGRVNAAVKTICASMCPEVMIVRNSTAPRAMLIANAGRGRLVYSPQFFASVHDSFGDAGIVSVIAHAFGHALDDSMGATWIRAGWTPELRADAWAGCTLARSSLGPSELDAALAALEKYPSPAHPNWSLRLPALRAGYTGCGGASSNFGARSGAGGRK